MFGALAAGFVGAESLTGESFMIRPPEDEELDDDERIARQVAFLKAALVPNTGTPPTAPPPPPPTSVVVVRAPLPVAPQEPGRTLKGSPFGPNDEPRPRQG